MRTRQELRACPNSRTYLGLIWGSEGWNKGCQYAGMDVLDKHDAEDSLKQGTWS